MLAHLEMRTPTSGKAGAAVVNASPGPDLYRNDFPSSTEIAVTDAVMHVRRAGRHLLEASFRLDESGLHCEALDDLASDTSALVAVWAGRLVPPFDTAPAYVAESAREWRRMQGRGY